jgi:hypothetical protein
MRKSALILMAALLAACFSLADADAAKKKKRVKAAPKDPILEWNMKNNPPWAWPGDKPAKKAKKKKGKKKAAKKKA